MEKIKIGCLFNDIKLLNYLASSNFFEITEINNLLSINKISDVVAIFYKDTNHIKEEILEFYDFFNINMIEVKGSLNYSFKIDDKEIDDLDSLVKILRKNYNKDNLYYTLSSINEIVEKREKCYYGHYLRTALLAKNFCKYLKLSENDINNIYVGALLHDIGKIVVPIDIIAKEGKLSNEEYEQIKIHSKIIDYFIPYNGKVKDIILHHHERLDGSGYPDHLCGNKISLGAQILGIIDSYDAMTSQRVYNRIMSKEDALKELKNCTNSEKDGKGVLYDKELVNKFINFMN